MESIKDRIAIIGAGCSKFGENWNKSPSDLILEADYEAYEDAGVDYDDIQAAIENFGGIDILVNNAGFLRDRMIFNMSPEDWDSFLKVHLYGHFNCTKAACVWFWQQWKAKGRGGRIINTSSVAGSQGNRDQTNYSAAKEGIVGFTRSLALEMSPYGVTTNAIRPCASTRMNTSPDALAQGENLGSTDWIKAALKMKQGVLLH